MHQPLNHLSIEALSRLARQALDVHFLAWLWFAPLLIVPIVIRSWARNQPSLGHSHLPAPPRKLLASVLPALRSTSLVVAIVCLCASLAYPVARRPVPGAAAEVIDVVFAVDISTNMREIIATGFDMSKEGLNPLDGSGTIQEWGGHKLDCAAFACYKIAEAIPFARFSIFKFDGTVYGPTPPLSKDHKFIFRAVRTLNKHYGDSSTDFDGPDPGRQEGEGILTSVLKFFQDQPDRTQFQARSKTKVVVFLTDGDGSIGSDRMGYFTAMFKKENIHVFMLGPGTDTVAYDPATDDIVQFSNGVGAPIIDCARPEQLATVIDAIKQLPTSEVQLAQVNTESPIFQDFLLVSLVGWCVFCVASAIMGRIL